MTWLRAHWRLAAAAGALAGAFLGGRLSVRPPAPSLALRQDTALQQASAQVVAKLDQKGAEDVVRRTFRPPPAGCPPGTPPTLASETTIHRGAERIDTNSQSRSDEQLDQHTDLRITPASPPRWALGAGLEDPLGARRVRIDAGMRLLGPVWLRAGAAPARGLSSATVGLEVQW